MKDESNGVNSVNNNDSIDEKTTVKNNRLPRQLTINKADSENFHEKQGEIERKRKQEWGGEERA